MSQVFARLISDAIGNNQYDKDVAYKEALYRSVDAKNGKSRKGKSSNLFTYYHFATPAQGQEGLNNSNAIVRGLPREFTVHQDEHTMDWFTQDSESTSDFRNNPMEKFRRAKILKRAREAGAKLPRGHYKKIYGGSFKGEHAASASLLGLKHGTDDPHYATTYHGIVSSEKHQGDKIAEIRGKQMYAREKAQAGVQTKLPPFVGSANVNVESD